MKASELIEILQKEIDCSDDFKLEACYIERKCVVEIYKDGFASACAPLAVLDA